MAKGKKIKKAKTEAAVRKKYATSGVADDIVVSAEDMLWIPSRFIALNHQLGGGVAYGKIIEIYGEESAGKSLLAFDFAYTTQALGGVVLWGDAEYAFTRDWATSNGLDLTKVELFKNKSIETLSDWSVDMGMYYRSKLKNNEPILMVIDSLAALDCLANEGLEQSDRKAEMGNRAKAMDLMLRSRNDIWEKLGITVILINQLRSKIGASQFEDPDCLHYNTNIPLTDGTFKTIGEIVENKLEVNIWSFDGENIVEKPVTDWISKEDWSKDDKWYNIQTTGPSTRNGVNGIICTGGHLVMDNYNNWVRADKLKVGDQLISKAELPKDYTNDILEMMSIGDMGINIRKDNTASITLRDNNNPEYINWKLNILSKLFNFSSSIDKRGYIYYRSDYHYYLQTIKRKVNRDPLNCNNMFRAESLAIWYMDDGHISKKGQVSICISPNRTDLLKLSLKFTKRGFECKPYKKGIRFTNSGGIKFLKYISSYIHTSMKYKIPSDIWQNSRYIDKYNNLFNTHIKPINVTVTKKCLAGDRNYRGKKRNIKYDLTVEGTHNFLAGNTNNGFVVHNTTPGGKATKFYASIRLGIYGGRQVKGKINGVEERVGRLSTIRVKKNKIAPPRKTLSKVPVFFNPEYDHAIGFDRYFELDEVLLKTGVLDKKPGASRYFYRGKVLANGKDNLIKLLQEDPKLRGKLLRKSGINTISNTRKKMEKFPNIYNTENMDL